MSPQLGDKRGRPKATTPASTARHAQHARTAEPSGHHGTAPALHLEFADTTPPLGATHSGAPHAANEAAMVDVQTRQITDLTGAADDDMGADDDPPAGGLDPSPPTVGYSAGGWEWFLSWL